LTKNGCDAHWLKIQGRGSADFSKIPGGRGFPDKIARGFPVLGWIAFLLTRFLFACGGSCVIRPFLKSTVSIYAAKGSKIQNTYLDNCYCLHNLIIQLNMIRKLGLFPRQRTRRRTWTRPWRHLDRLMFRALVRLKSAKPYFSKNKHFFALFFKIIQLWGPL